MPNGHGIPLGCFVCKQYQKGEPNPLVGRCQHHIMEVHMDLVCADFDNTVNDAKPSSPPTKGTLYAYIDVEDHGYPPPTELVHLAKIIEYKDWSDTQRQQAWAVAQRKAIVIFEQRK